MGVAQKALISKEPAGLSAPRPQVAVVVVNYRTYDDVVRCLTSLNAQTVSNFLVVLVDNNSPDGSGARLRRAFESERCHYLHNPDNSGFAGGNNVGISYARALSIPYVWLLNPDTECEPQALAALLAALEADQGAGAVGSKVLYGGESRRRIWSCGGFVDLDQQKVWMRGTDEEDSGQFDTPAQCGYLPGCSLLARTSLFDEVGLLPEHYFMYFEETDWCLQVAAKGYTLKYVPQSVVYHHFSDAKMQGAMTVYYYNRNQRLFWMRYSSSKRRAALWWKTLSQELPQALEARRGTEDPGLQRVFQAHVKSAVDALLFRGGRRW